MQNPKQTRAAMDVEAAPAGEVRASLVQSWLDSLCRMIPGVKHGYARLLPGAGPGVNARWPPAQPSPAGLDESVALVMERSDYLVRQSDSGPAHLDVACPLNPGGGTVGAVVVRTDWVTREQQQAVVRLCQWGETWLALLLGTGQSRLAAGAPESSGLLAASLAAGTFAAAATGLATGLAERLGCERVTLAWQDKRRLRVCAVSDGVSFKSRSNLVRGLEAVMDELLERGVADGAPAPRLAATGYGTDLLAVPLVHRGRVVGAVGLERTTGQGFAPWEAAWCETLGAPAGAALALQRYRERPLAGILAQRLKEYPGRMLAGSHTKAALALLVSVLVLGWLVFGTGEYRVTAPASLEGRVQRAIVAPYAGYVRAAAARAGERVRAGQMLAELDDRDLMLERRRWQGQREELEKQYRKALAGLEHSEARILQAQIAQSEARLSLVEEQLARAHLTAPFDGVIISGDLSRSLGMPVERGQLLFEVAPLDGYRVVLRIDDADIADIAVGQDASLALSALPGTRFPLTVTDIATFAGGGEGAGGFRVEARLDGDAARLLPGMQGIGKVSIGERSLLWIGTRRLLAWTRMQLWAWSP